MVYVLSKSLGEIYCTYALPMSTQVLVTVFSLFKEISLNQAISLGSGISYNEDIMHSFQKFIVVLFLKTLLSLKQAYVN